MVQNVSLILSASDSALEESSISSLDIELITNILNKTLAVASPTEADQIQYMESFDALQTAQPENLQAANEKDDTIKRFFVSIIIYL